MQKESKEEQVSLRVAVIGSGPAGFYTAEQLLKEPSLSAHVDMFEKLPVPFGLVRYGVAPDHAKIKSVTAKYEQIATNPRFRFFGNVTIGKDISVETLRQYYHQIVYAVGSQTDRQLSLPGIEADGCHSATAFVAWFNGHPDYQAHQFDLTQKRIMIVGIGNVALDVARILTRPVEELAQTDIADYALAALRASQVEDVYLLGRRGVAQAAFSPTEIRELGELTDVDVVVDPADVMVSEEALANLDRQSRRNVEIVQAYAKRPLSNAKRRIHLRFLTSPTGISADKNGRIQSVCLVKNELYKNEQGALKARPTNQYEPVNVGMLFTSIGYRGVPMAGVPFDDWSGTFANKNGRIINPLTNQHNVGEYAAGWIKRGPNGVIGTNKADAIDTVKQMVADAHQGVVLLPQCASPEAIIQLLQSKQINAVSFSDWQYLDAQEQLMGQLQGRPRVKFTCVEQMVSTVRNRS